MNKNNDLARGAPSARADTTRYTAVAKGLHWLLARIFEHATADYPNKFRYETIYDEVRTLVGMSDRHQAKDVFSAFARCMTGSRTPNFGWHTPFCPRLAPT